MDKAEKERIVKLLNQRFSESEFVFLTRFQGLNVAAISSVRRELRAAGTGLRVLKNTLARRAMRGTGAQSLNDDFTGPTAVVWGSGDPVAAARIMTRFAKDYPNLEFKSGLLQGTIVPSTDLVLLSKLPSRQVLLSQLLSVLQTKPAGLVNLLAGLLTRFLSTLQAIEHQKSKTGSC